MRAAGCELAYLSSATSSARAACASARTLRSSAAGFVASATFLSTLACNREVLFHWYMCENTPEAAAKWPCLPFQVAKVYDAACLVTSAASTPFAIQ